jgi:hypothetical protein
MRVAPPRRSATRRGCAVKKQDPEQWQIVFYETADGKRPAQKFLAGAPEEVRKELLATLRAARDVGPMHFKTSGDRWQLMHKPKKKGQVDMSGICEARDQQGDTLYRLYCVIDRNAPQHGLQRPSLVLLGGAAKPVRTAVPQSEYKRIDGYRDDWWATRRFARKPAATKNRTKGGRGGA